MFIFETVLYKKRIFKLEVIKIIFLGGWSSVKKKNHKTSLKDQLKLLLNLSIKA